MSRTGLWLLSMGLRLLRGSLGLLSDLGRSLLWARSYDLLGRSILRRAGLSLLCWGLRLLCGRLGLLSDLGRSLLWARSYDL